jgi:uncharacterized protein (TIGR02594 family)
MSPRWIDIAGALLTTKEIVGPKSNPVIMKWAADIGGWVKSYYTNDDIPWCGLFMAHVFQQAGIKDVPKNPLSARAWKDFGVEVTPRPGAVLIFRRPGGAHVGIMLAQSATHYLVRGGNQKNAVSDTWIEKDRLEAARWPRGEPIPKYVPVYLKTGKETSKNEA